MNFPLKFELNSLLPNNLVQLIFFIIFLFNLFFLTIVPYFITGKFLYSIFYLFPIIFYLIIFFTYSIVSKRRFIYISQYLLYLFLLSFILIFIGFINGNYFIDIVSNLFFFIAPFIGYYVSKSILRESNDKIWVLNNFIYLSILQIVFFFILKMIRFFFMGQDFVIYKAFNVDGLQSSILVCIFLLYIYKNHKHQISNIFKFVIFTLCVNELLYPISLPFKQLLFSLVVAILFILFFVFRINKILLVGIFSAFVLFILNYYSTELYVLTRFINYYQDLLTISLFKDKRIVEIYGVLSTLYNNLPTSLFFGEGFGGLWNADLLNLNPNFLKNVDFRKGAFVSMVHSSYFTILLRSGLFGLFFYFIFFYKIKKSLKKIIKLENLKDTYLYYVKSFRFYFILTLILSFFDYYIYANTFWGVIAYISTSFIFNNSHNLEPKI
jgi:hypothetical protein